MTADSSIENIRKLRGPRAIQTVKVTKGFRFHLVEPTYEAPNNFKKIFILKLIIFHSNTTLFMNSGKR